MAVNTNITVLNVVGATTTQTSAIYKNEWGCGAEVYFNVSNAGTGSITLTVQGIDPASGTAYTILAGTAVTSNGLTRYFIFPGATTTANTSVNDMMPYSWRILVTANNANPVTYSVGVTLFG